MKAKERMESARRSGVLPAARWRVAAMASAMLLTCELAVLVPQLAPPVMHAVGSAMTQALNPDACERELERSLRAIAAGEWERADAGRRLELLQAVADYEARLLGAWPPPVLTCEFLSRLSMVRASYSFTYNTIAYDSFFIEEDDFEEAIDAICHEVYHAYQNRVVAGILPEPETGTREAWARELEDYVSSGDEAYRDQEVEVWAREYAAGRLSWYREKLEQLRLE